MDYYFGFLVKIYFKRIILVFISKIFILIKMYYILGPKSFTGEDCCEFQIHGGRAVIASVLHGLSKLPNFRPADPGK